MTEQRNIQILGWDIGGAHVKLAARDGQRIEVFQWPCPLWQGIEQLENCLREAKTQIVAKSAEHRIAMTGELVDLFPDRKAGVRAILTVFGKYFPAQDQNYVFGREGLQPVHKAWSALDQFASFNWLATATYVAEQCKQGILLDVGSTTTDVIAFKDAEPAAAGIDDHTRLKSLELVYTGVVRTGIGHVVSAIPFQEEMVPIAAEYFSTMADVYRITEQLPVHADLYPSADHAGKTVEDSMRRFARMVCLDYLPSQFNEWRISAEYVAAAQTAQIKRAVCQQIARCQLNGAVLVGAGVGSFLVENVAALLDIPYVGFDQLLLKNGYKINRLGVDCAPAVALVA